MIFVATIARWIFSASSRVISWGRRLVFTLARSQISSAIRPLMREKSCWRQARRLRVSVSRSICISTPSSTPYGCGLISAVSGGSSRVTRSKSTTPLVLSGLGGEYSRRACGLAMAIWRR